METRASHIAVGAFVPWLVLRIVSSALENSDLVSVASDDELRDTQKYVRLAGILLSRCDDRPVEETGDTRWPSWLADRMAPTLLGNTGSILAARIAYHLDLSGPAVPKVVQNGTLLMREQERSFLRKSFNLAAAPERPTRTVATHAQHRTECKAGDDVARPVLVGGHA